jgi:hypothetical protein
MHSWHLSSVRRIVVSRGHLALALLLVVITSCSNSSLTEPDRVPSTFTAARVSGTFPPPSPVVHVADGSIRIDGQIAAPTPCYTLSGSTSIARDTLVARVVAQSTVAGGGLCAQAIQFWQYTLTVNRPLTAITVVRVTHDTGNGKAEVVLEQQVTVP